MVHDLDAAERCVDVQAVADRSRLHCTVAAACRPQGQVLLVSHILDDHQPTLTKPCTEKDAAATYAHLVTAKNCTWLPAAAYANMHGRLTPGSRAGFLQGNYQGDRLNGVKFIRDDHES